MKKKYYSELKFIAFIPFFAYSLFNIWIILANLSAWVIMIIGNFIMGLFLSIASIYIYVIKDEMLIIKQGFVFRAKTEIKDIKMIRAKKKRFSLLFDKIEIIDNTYYEITLIAPKDMQSFANELLSINPDIEILI